MALPTAVSSGLAAAGGILHRPRSNAAYLAGVPAFLRLQAPSSAASGGGHLAVAGSGFRPEMKKPASLSPPSATSTLGSTSMETDSVPVPVVLIDQDSDSDATIVQLSFGDRLGALMDTMQALKDLGLDVTKGTVSNEVSKFFIMKRGRKVEDPVILENIRLTIINNLLKYHPESSERLAMGEFFGVKPPEKLDVDIATQVFVRDDGPKRSLLYIESADRAGLLLDIVKIITYINIDVESAEIDTEGLVAKDKFHVSYKDAALDGALSQLLTNCLRFYLRRPETEEDSY